MNYDMQAWTSQYVQREPWQKKTTFFFQFYIAFILHSISECYCLSTFCQRIYNTVALESLSRSNTVWTGPAWDDDTVVQAQGQRNGRIIHQHQAFHTAAQTTQILKTAKENGRKMEKECEISERRDARVSASDARRKERKETVSSFFIFGTVFLLSLSCLNTLPWGKHHRVPHNADLKFVKKHGKGFGKKARHQQHQHIATPKLTKMVQHETRKNSCTDLHSLCHWRYCMGKHGSLAFNFRHVFLDRKSIEDYKILNKDFHRKPTALAKGLFVWDPCDRALWKCSAALDLVDLEPGKTSTDPARLEL